MMTWAIKWRSNCHIDGRREHLMGRYGCGIRAAPDHLAGYTKMAFKTRQSAREFITENYGYIRTRPDLRREPHGWKIPIPVRVIVTVTEL